MAGRKWQRLTPSVAMLKPAMPLLAVAAADQYKRAGEAVYQSWRWRMLSRKVIKEVGHCQSCGAAGSDQVMLDCNHRIPLFQLGPEPHKHPLAWSRENLEVLCRPCHAKRTRADRVRAGAIKAKPSLIAGLGDRLAWLADDDFPPAQGRGQARVRGGEMIKK